MVIKLIIYSRVVYLKNINPLPNMSNELLGIKLTCNICLEDVPSEDCRVLYGCCKECLGRIWPEHEYGAGIAPTPTPTSPEPAEPISQNIVNDYNDDYDYGVYNVLSHVDPVVLNDPIFLRNSNLTYISHTPIRNNSDKPWNWNWNWVSTNQNITMYDIDTNTLPMYEIERKWRDSESERKWRDSESERKWREKDRHQRMKQAQRLKLKDRKQRYMTTNHIKRHQKKVKKTYNNRY